MTNDILQSFHWVLDLCLEDLWFFGTLVFCAKAEHASTFLVESKVKSSKILKVAIYEGKIAQTKIGG